MAGDSDAGYDVAERDEIVEVGTVYATYAHDPLTAPDNPRGVLYNSNLIKISIADSGRDKRTPILLAAGDAPVHNPVDEGRGLWSAAQIYASLTKKIMPDTDDTRS